MSKPMNKLWERSTIRPPLFQRFRFSTGSFDLSHNKTKLFRTFRVIPLFSLSFLTYDGIVNTNKRLTCLFAINYLHCIYYPMISYIAYILTFSQQALLILFPALSHWRPSLISDQHKNHRLCRRSPHERFQPSLLSNW